MRVFFFFFKQKTAYEMRISDWSSDVCSSDLRLRDPPDHPAGIVRHQRAAVFGDLDVGGAAACGLAILAEKLVEKGDRQGALGLAIGADLHEHHAIGRASCRERVCKDV